MTPDEQRMIEDLFDRLASQRSPSKDRQADALIQRAVRDIPDAAYMLVQTALVYEHQLQEASDRIQRLEAELDGAAPARAGGGSFLSGRLGGSARAPEPAERSGLSPWGRGPAAPPAAPPAASAPAAASGGGFLRSAMTTAAGVAGGILAAESLRSLFGGSASHASEGHHRGEDQAALADADRTQDQMQDELLAQDDTDQDWGGGDDGGSMDI